MCTISVISLSDIEFDQYAKNANSSTLSSDGKSVFERVSFDQSTSDPLGAKECIPESRSKFSAPYDNFIVLDTVFIVLKLLYFFFQSMT